MNTRRPVVIGLAGGTGAGKTTVAETIISAAGEDGVVILPHDAYYHAQHDVPLEARAATNYDEPSAFDTALLALHIDALLRGEAVARPVYDFAAHNRAAHSVPLEPRPVMVVEGILVLHEAELRQRMDLRIFVDAPADERFIRRLERDVKERGRSATSVIQQYRRSVKPMHDMFVEPSKQHANLILPEGGRNHIALEVLTAFVASIRSRYESV